MAQYLLGHVYADLGRTQKAIQLQRHALALATEQNSAALVQLINAHLAELMR